MDAPGPEDRRPVERRVSFDAVAATYDLVRHDYPPEAFADLLAFLREKRPVDTPSVVEIGPGTGKATRGLLDAGARVTGVELGPQMAAFLRSKFSAEGSLTVVESSFEEVSLPPASFDAVVAATSFHWVDPAVRLSKAAELLAPDGVLAVLATVQVDSNDPEGYFGRSSPLYLKYGQSEESGYVAQTRETAAAPEFGELDGSPLLADAVCRRYSWDQTYTTLQYADLLRSYSNMQMMDPGPREALIAELCELADTEFGGTVVRPLVIVMSMARKAG